MQIPNRSREDQKGVPALSSRTSLHLFGIGSGMFRQTPQGGIYGPSTISSVSRQKRPSLARPQSLQLPDNPSLTTAPGRSVQGVAPKSSRCGPLPPSREAMQLKRLREDREGGSARLTRMSLHLSRIASGEHPGIHLAQPTLEMPTSLGARSTATHHSRGKSFPPRWRQWGSPNGSLADECAIAICSSWLDGPSTMALGSCAHSLPRACIAGPKVWSHTHFTKQPPLSIQLATETAIIRMYPKCLPRLARLLWEPQGHRGASA
jgi:hypothetical protein